MALTKPSFKYRIVHKAIDRHNKERMKFIYFSNLSCHSLLT